MSNRTKITIDGNEAVAYVSFKLNEVMAIYPITPSSNMGEWCDQWASEGKKNIWGTIPSVVEMQSEGGAAGAIHGALQTGALANTYTASQGLLLKIPNMFKIAGELLPTVFHITARTLATHALSIFGDHSDVMSARSTGFAMLSSASVQEAMDLACIAQAATFKARVPFLHFFDGFRTSHEVQKIEQLSDEDLMAMMDMEAIAAHRNRAMSPDRPVLRGTAQNPDAYFQGREACNPYFTACPGITQQVMDQFAKLVGRQYKLFQYVGSPQAENIIILMGSGCEAAHETVDYLNGKGSNVGVLKVRLFRPFDLKSFMEALPATVKKITVLDRTKEPGATGEPLYQDVITALVEGLGSGYGQIKAMPQVLGGRYGLSSKEFTPAMVKAVYDNMAVGHENPHKVAFDLVRDACHLLRADHSIKGGGWYVGSIELFNTPFDAPPEARYNTPFEAVEAYVKLNSPKGINVGVRMEGDEMIGYVKSPLQPKNHFTVGINDDVANTSLAYDPEFSTESDKVIRAMFYGLGADGTVGANKNSIKIIGEETENFAQGYFVYDSKKSGSMTVSHLRFGPSPIRSTYLVTKAQFVACHQPVFLERYDMVKNLIDGGTFLLNTPYSKDEIWSKLPRVIQEGLIKKKAKFYVIDATSVARQTGMGQRINTIMQVCFFALSGVLPRNEAIEAIKYSIKKTYGKKGEDVVRKNIEAVDGTLANLQEVTVPSHVTSKIELAPGVTSNAPKYVQQVMGKLAAGLGDELPVSAFACDGSFPTATAQYEKRNLALEIPVWDEKVCIQCAKCVVVCPHATIRMKVYDAKCLEKAPAAFKSTDARHPDWKGMKFTLQIAPEDCTGCALCVDVCPARNKTEAKLKAINMRPQPPLREQERVNWEFFLALPEFDRRKVKTTQLRQQQIMRPLFEFSGACTGCGETPYIKLLTQLFGDRAVIGNATGCSSIYGGNLPTTPYAVDANGRGPTWCNSLFEDNAEFGLGFRVSIDAQKEFAAELVKKLTGVLGQDLVDGIVNANQSDEAGIYEQRERVAALKQKLQGQTSTEAKMLLPIADILVRKSVWILGGDGWAYDIGYGGLDHVLASGRDVNVLVMDTEVYSNTGGQMSKATPRGAVAKFAAGGKPLGKKDLGLIAMTYGNIYVASVAMGAKDEHTLKAFVEAESYNGPSLIIAYSHCIAHGIDLDRGIGMRQQKLMVDTGQWLLYRFDPRRAVAGENPLQLDSQAAKMKVQDFLMSENRFKMLTKSKPEDAKRFFELAQHDADARWAFYSHLAERKLGNGKPAAPATPAV